MIGFVRYDGHDELMTNFKRSSCVTHSDYDDMTTFSYIVELIINKIDRIITSFAVKAPLGGGRSSCSSYSVTGGYDDHALSPSYVVIKSIITVTEFKDWYCENFKPQWQRG